MVDGYCHQNFQMEVECSPETLVTIDQTSWSHFLEECLNTRILHCCNFTFRIL
jgi:hypothetical protein